MTRLLRAVINQKVARYCSVSLVALGSFLLSADAQQPPDGQQPSPKDEKATRGDPISITFSARQSANKDIMTAVSFDVLVSNLATEEIVIREIRLDIQEPVPSTRALDTWTRSSGGDIQLPPGATVPRTLTMPGLDATWFSYCSALMKNPRLLTFAPGDYDATVIVDYRRPTQTYNLQLTKSTKLTFSSALGAIVLGTVFGSVLGVLFRSAWRLTKQNPRPTVANEVRDALLAFPTSVLGAIIISLILYRLKDVQLPIAVTVNDFFGGIVIGLFTYKLADWIYEKLFQDKTT